MPAATLVPAPIAYVKVVAVKKLVVGIKAMACKFSVMILKISHVLKKLIVGYCIFLSILLALRASTK